jgi:hypothetical protein
MAKPYTEPMKFEKVSYKELNSRQQEAHNFQKLSGVLADYGIITIKLSSDWEGADLIAQHCHKMEFLPIQLKGRFTLEKKYCGKGLWVAFSQGDDWYLYDHDEVLAKMQADAHPMFTSSSWTVQGGYNFPSLSKKIEILLEQYRLI